MTRLAPRSRCPAKVSGVKNLPVHSSTTSTPRSPQGISAAVAYDENDKLLSLIRIACSRSAAISARHRPCTLSNSSKCAVACAPPLISFKCTTSSRLPARGSSLCRSAAPIAARSARRPMRPRPLIPTFMLISLAHFGEPTAHIHAEYTIGV